MVEIPPMISVDDHVLEPPDLWQRWLPARWRDEDLALEVHAVIRGNAIRSFDLPDELPAR